MFRRTAASAANAAVIATAKTRKTQAPSGIERPRSCVGTEKRPKSADSSTVPTPVARTDVGVNVAANLGPGSFARR